ncbi:radical SAM protein [Pelagibius sp. CAU 1746]|uniref:radical SAM protein n=1 Tax=Pelagibius sp. CAU 1746 TaxID=3140370 RepID=UPI00325AD8F3
MSEIRGARRDGGSPGAASRGKVAFLQLEPTTRCNFICGFCSGRQMDQTDFAVEDFDRLLEAFPEVEHIELQGEGEPLLHKGFFAMARRARTRGIRLSMITNGSLLSEERVAAILDLGMEAINVSVESPDEDEFRDIRGGSFAKVKAGIARLLEARRARGLDRPLVGFAITVLKHTVERLPEIAALYEELGMDGGATVQPLSRMDAFSKVYDEEVAAQFLDEADTQRLLRLRNSDPKVRAMTRQAAQSGHFYPEMHRRFPILHGCPWVRGGLYVDRHGALLSCCMVKDAAAHGLGKLGITPVEAVLNRRREIDAALSAGRPPEQCRGCAYYRPPEQREVLLQRMRARNLQRRRAEAAKPE